MTKLKTILVLSFLLIWNLAFALEGYRYGSENKYSTIFQCKYLKIINFFGELRFKHHNNKTLKTCNPKYNNILLARAPM